MQTFELWVVVKGSTPVKVLQLPMVRISMALEMDVETFLNTDTTVFTTGLANALGIDASTIRVTGACSIGAGRILVMVEALRSLTRKVPNLRKPTTVVACIFGVWI